KPLLQHGVPPFATMMRPAASSPTASGLLRPVEAPTIRATGATLPFAPAAKTSMALATLSATYSFPVLSSAMPSGEESVVLAPEMVRVGATLPDAPAGEEPNQ